MKPILKYPGGKRKELNIIKKFIPQYEGKYIEPFFGGGALFFELEPKNSLISDINQKLMNFYKEIGNNFEIVINELNQLEEIYKKNYLEFQENKKKTFDKIEYKNEVLYYKFRDYFNGKKSNFNEATIYYFINKLAYSGIMRYNSKGEFNVPFGRYVNLNSKLLTQKHSDLLKNTNIMCKDYKEIFKLAQKEDFIFLDPPYDSVFTSYNNNLFGKKEQVELSEEFKKLKAKTLLVIGKTPLTEKLYKNYIKYEYDKNYAINIKRRVSSKAKHLIISNY